MELRARLSTALSDGWGAGDEGSVLGFCGVGDASCVMQGSSVVLAKIAWVSLRIRLSFSLFL